MPAKATVWTRSRLTGPIVPEPAVPAGDRLFHDVQGHVDLEDLAAHGVGGRRVLAGLTVAEHERSLRAEGAQDGQAADRRVSLGGRTVWSRRVDGGLLEHTGHAEAPVRGGARAAVEV